MNFGGEVDYGNQHNPLQPQLFTTANDQSSTSSDVIVAVALARLLHVQQ